MAAGESLTQWLRALRATPALEGRWRRLPGALLAWRDAAPFVRLHFLAIATEIGLLEELGRGPATTNQLGVRLAIADRALFGAFLRLGVGTGRAALPGRALVAARQAQQGPGRTRGRHDAGHGGRGHRL